MANVPASLKPLTPVAGTNLFLNTVYKWHDHTEQGCYVTAMNISNDNEDTPDAMMMCNREDQKWYDTSASDWILERKDGQESTDEYNGTVGIKNVGANRLFNPYRKNRWGDWVVNLLSSLNSRNYYMLSDPSNKKLLKIAMRNRFLHQTPAGNHRSSFIHSEQPAAYRYEFLPAIKVRINMYNFEFTEPMDDEIAKHTSEKGLIDAYSINNNSPGTLSRSVSVSESVTDTFSWGFSEKFSIGTKIKATAGIPFLAEGEMETSFSFEIGAKQDTTNSVKKEFQMSYTVKVPPNSSVKISAWYDLIKGIAMDYTATLEITGKTERVTIFNDVVQDTPASGIMIRKHLDLTNFDGKIVEIREHSVIASFKGTMVASVGVRGRLNVNDETVASAPTPN